MRDLTKLHENLLGLKHANTKVGEALTAITNEPPTPITESLLALATAIDETATVVLDLLNEQVQEAQDAA